MIGKRIENRYEVLSVLGKGGMAVVYLALDWDEDKEVALKVLSKAAEGWSERVLRFQREFKLCQQVNHPNIIKLHDFGKVGDSSYFTVMDVIEGDDLQSVIDGEGSLDEELVLKLAKGLAAGLAALHEVPIVHRDLKPANIMLVDGDEGDDVEAALRPVIMDFGLARSVNVTALTATGTLLGTPYYMSPELAVGERADERSDIYQLGVILYEALTGKRPYKARSIEELFKNIVSQDPKAVSQLKPELAHWEFFLNKCMAKDPQNRYQSIGQVEKALCALGQGQPVALESGTDEAKNGLQGEAKNEPRNEPKAAVAPPTRSKRKNKRYLVLAGIVCLLLFAFALLRSQGPNVYSVRDLKIAPNINSIELSWHSEQPYLSVVQITKPSKRMVSGKGSECKHHQLRLDKLEEGTKYSFRIVFPNGQTSLVQQAETKKLTFAINEFKQLADGSRELVLSTKEKIKEAKVVIGRSKGEVLSQEAEVFAGELRTKLPFIPVDGESIHVEVSLADGTLHKVDLAPNIAKSALTLANKVKAINGKDAVHELGVIGWYDPTVTMKRVAIRVDMAQESESAANKRLAHDRQKKAEVVKALRSKLLPYDKVLSQYRKSKFLLPLALKGRFLSLRDRCAINKACEGLVTIYAFSAMNKDPFDDYCPLPQRGLFGFYAKPMSELRPKEKLRLVAEQEIENWGMYSLDMGVSIGFKLPAVPRWSKEFKVNNLDDIACGEIYFRFRRFDHTALRLKINDNFSVLLYGEHHFASSRHELWQCFPADVLRNGQNQLTLIHEKMGRGQLEHRVRIREMGLLLYGP